MRKSFSLNLAAGALAVGMAAAPSFADVKLSDGLSLSGFIDMSATSVIPDGGDATLNASFDQFELDFLYKFSDKLTARVDVNSLGGGAVVLEQAFLTYTAGPVAFSTGKFLSASGFEAAEPTGLYQYSTSKTLVYGGYQNGANVAVTLTPMISLYGAVVGSVWNGFDTDLTKPGFEAQVALTPVAGLTIKAAYLFDAEVSDVTTTYPVVAGEAVPTDVEGDGTDQSLANVWASYAVGPLTVAGEFNYLINWGAGDDAGIGYLGMVNYKLTDKLGVTGRYSALKMDVPGAVTDNEVTFSPGYAISSAWFVLAEAKYEIELKQPSFAVESILTF